MEKNISREKQLIIQNIRVVPSTVTYLYSLSFIRRSAVDLKKHSHIQYWRHNVTSAGEIYAAREYHSRINSERTISVFGRPKAAPFCSMHMHRARSPISCRQCKISAAINSCGYRSPDSPLLPTPPRRTKRHRRWSGYAKRARKLWLAGKGDRRRRNENEVSRATKREGSCATRVWPSNRFEWVSNRLGRRSIVLLAEQLVPVPETRSPLLLRFQRNTRDFFASRVHVAPHPCHLCIIFPLRSLFHSAYSPLLKRVNSASRAARDKWIQSHREHRRSQCSSGLIQFSSELGRIIFILILHLITYNCFYNSLNFSRTLR